MAASRVHATAEVDVERDCLPAARDSLILAVVAARQSAEFYQLAHDGGNALLSELAGVGLRKQAVLEEELERIEERIRSDAGWSFGVPRRTRCPTPE